ncbi:MAG: hypothetical protein ACO3EZ_12120 [Prochlorotrichaceae cyanobacterium]|jgi:hypothetical protein
MMRDPNRRLITTVLLGWAAFAGLGIILRQAIAMPRVTVVIDRSYCEPQKWQRVVDRYQALYAQHQKKQLQIEAVILFSDLGEETLETPLDPSAVQQLKTYGRKDLEREQALSSTVENMELLSCPDP